MSCTDILGLESQLNANYGAINRHFSHELKHHRCVLDSTRFLSILEMRGMRLGPGKAAGDHTLIIIPGRGENEHKYAELLYSLRDSDLDIFVCFVRGQGHSTADMLHSQKCHVNAFTDYRHDLEAMLDFIQPAEGFKMMTFSLGGLISLDYIMFSAGRHRPSALSLIAPFLGVNYHVNDSLLYAFVKAVCLVPALGRSYTPYGQNYRRIPFADNYHSHSMIRYKIYHDYYANHLEETIGGPTFNFVKCCMQAQRRIMRHDFNFGIPLLCQSAEKDRVVDSNAAAAFMARHANDRVPPRFRMIQGAYHDILNESDDYRNPTLYRSLHFLFPHIFKEEI